MLARAKYQSEPLPNDSQDMDIGIHDFLQQIVFSLIPKLATSDLLKEIMYFSGV